MTKGDKVKVYQKPITNEDYEGVAVLVRPVGKTEARSGIDGLEDWMVRFPNEVTVVRRLVDPKNIVADSCFASQGA